MATYHAFHYAKMNQSFKMEDENNKSLYEANLIKFRLLGASDFEFVNQLTSERTLRKISKTVSVSEGAAGISMTQASSFKMDGINCFDLLESKGYTLKLIMKFDLIHPKFGLFDRDGNKVAVYKMNVVGEREEGVGAIGNKQSNTEITTDSVDTESVFLGAFILSRVDFSLYLM